MAQITVYQKPTCSTCRKVLALIEEKGLETRSINYFDQPMTYETLKRLIGLMEMTPEELLRKKENRYRELSKTNALSGDDQTIKAMVAYPELMQRPIVECDGKAVLARPLEKIYDII